MDANLTAPCNPIITGIDAEKFIQLSVYPNPSHHEFHITGLPQNEQLFVVIYDQTGREIIAETTRGQEYVWYGDDSSGNKVKAGIYILKVVTRNALISTLKLMKTE